MLENYNKNDIKQNLYLLWVDMGHHALAWGSTSLWNGSFGSMEEWRRGRVNCLRGKWFQGTHTCRIMIGK